MYELLSYKLTTTRLTVTIHFVHAHQSQTLALGPLSTAGAVCTVSACVP